MLMMTWSLDVREKVEEADGINGGMEDTTHSNTSYQDGVMLCFQSIIYK